MTPSYTYELPITGISAINALGHTRTTIVDHLRSGQSGLSAPPFPLPFTTVSGNINHPLAPLPPSLKAYDTRLARMIQHLMHQLDDELQSLRSRWRPERIGVFLGTSTAGAATTELAYTHYIKQGALPKDYNYKTQHTFGAALEIIRHLTGAKGPGWVVSTACTSSAKTFGSAARMIATDIIDAAIVGGVDTLCAMTLCGFGSLGALSQTPCRPFSEKPSGINIGEGGALAVLERKGDAQILLEGVGESSDAYHISAPHPDGLGAALAMKRALPPNVSFAQIDHVNAHGTGTQHNDHMESKALHECVGDAVPVISTKGYTGHTLGGAGATELALASWMMLDNFIAASVGSAPPDPKYGISVVLETTPAQLTRVLTNSFAFGGNNICLCLRAV
ncbi:MAG: beta-ketoacyl-ACP synthase [Myxococcales bacterium]|nr:beta-ketoacyl-ACP synthase [Myxococcales bacterium]